MTEIDLIGTFVFMCGIFVAAAAGDPLPETLG